MIDLIYKGAILYLVISIMIPITLGICLIIDTIRKKINDNKSK